MKIAMKKAISRISGLFTESRSDLVSNLQNSYQKIVLFGKKNKDNVCYCETCKHKTASECLELKCHCCLEADRIRLEHPVVPQEDLSAEGKLSQEEEAEHEKEKEQQQVNETSIDTNVIPWV